MISRKHSSGWRKLVDTEALIMAAWQAEVCHTGQDQRCRLCQVAPEAVQHRTAGCKKLTGRAKLERHNQVDSVVFRDICSKYGLEVLGSKWAKPPMLIAND